MIGLGTSITDVAEFNRRALIALKGVRFGKQNSAPGIIAFIEHCHAQGKPILAKPQQALFNIVHRFRAQISDKLVTEYAATRARGHEA